MSGDLLQTLLQQHGLLGLVIGFLILGPGFTYIRTRNMRDEAEAKTQALLNEFAQKERERSERLEARLEETLQKLNQAEDEVISLRLKLAQAQSELEKVAALREQIQVLTNRVNELESLLEQSSPLSNTSNERT